MASCKELKVGLLVPKDVSSPAVIELYVAVAKFARELGVSVIGELQVIRPPISPMTMCKDFGCIGGPTSLLDPRMTWLIHFKLGLWKVNCGYIVLVLIFLSTAYVLSVILNNYVASIFSALLVSTELIAFDVMLLMGLVTVINK